MSRTCAGNQTLSAYVLDGGTRGVGVEKIWVRVDGTGNTSERRMATPAASNAQLLTGGNIHVPKPSAK